MVNMIAKCGRRDERDNHGVDSVKDLVIFQKLLYWWSKSILFSLNDYLTNQSPTIKRETQ